MSSFQTQITPLLLSRVMGTTTNNNAQAGDVGEVIRSFIPLASAVPVIDSTAKDITSIVLTPGDWDVSALGALAGTLTGTESRIYINTTANTFPASTVWADQTASTPAVPTAITNVVLSIPAFRVSIAVTTTYYFGAYSAFTVGTATAYGRISARRMR